MNFRCHALRDLQPTDKGIILFPKSGFQNSHGNRNGNRCRSNSCIRQGRKTDFLPSWLQLNDSAEKFRDVSQRMRAPCMGIAPTGIVAALEDFPRCRCGDHVLPMCTDIVQGILPQIQFLRKIQQICGPECSRLRSLMQSIFQTGNDPFRGGG